MCSSWTARSRGFVVSLVALGALVVPAAAGADDELSFRLDALAGGQLEPATNAGEARALAVLPDGPGSLMRDGGKLVVDIGTSGDANEVADLVAAAGGEVSAVSVPDHVLSAAVAESDLRAVAVLPGVASVTEVLTPMTGTIDSPDSGGGAGAGALNTCGTGVVSEGVAQLKAGLARTQFDVDGTGVKVGVLSDSYNSSSVLIKEPNDIASGDLPGAGNPCGRAAPVQVLAESPTPAADEGRAMTQIVHDVAPGAELAFASANPSDVAFANNIRALADSGADVIADDIIYFNEPFFQDGLIANAVTDVTNDGVAYFSMAFNDNRVIGGNDSNSWEAPAFRTDGGACPALVGGTDCMDFDPGAGVDNTFNITSAGQPVSGTRPFRFVLNWAEPQNGVTTDFDLYVINQAAAQVFSSTNVNATTGKAFEFVGFNPGNTSPNNYQVVIKRVSGTGTPRLKWVNADNGAGSIAGLEYPTSAGGDIVGPTIFGHNGTAAAQTVGAVPFNNSATIEPFSSRGPVTHYFGPVNGVTPAAALGAPEVLSKPDLSATDGGINTFFGSGCPTCRFFGTSAATPHAAAVAALQLEANSGLTQGQVKSSQKATAVAVGAFPVLAQGAGLLDAQAAIASKPPALPTVNASGPALTRDATPEISLATTGDIKNALCTIDGGAAQPCAPPAFKPATALSDGNHDIAVTVFDYFGQSGAGTARVKVDTTAPAVKVKKGPKKRSRKTTAKFKLTTDAGAQLECKVDKAAFKSCGTKLKVKAKPGKHVLLVHATDEAGNVSKDVKYKWKVTK